MRKWLRRTGWTLAAGVVLAGGVWLLCPRPALYGDIGFSTAVEDRDGGLLRLGLAADGRYRLFTPLNDIAPAAVEATLLYEDAHFFRHPGVNPASLLRAAWTTYVTRERTVGASTISMQLARLRFGIDSGNIPGKLWQILRALQLERHYDKRQLLEAYLNLAPYGGNVEGIGTASRVYFGKPAAELTTLEALTLAVVPQDPNARQPGPDGGGAELTAARLRLFEAWRAAHPEDTGLASRLALPLPARGIGALPFRAPHFADLVLARHARPGVLRTTLRPGLQRLAETAVAEHVARRRDEGIRNAAVLIVDTRDTSIAALVGSADWFNAAIDGQVNGVTARRSPGSALKPFIYAQALDQGLIHPMTLLKDAPVRYAAYTPENFDQGFVGPVFARDALIYSRNVPALNLAARLENPDFYAFLQQAGIGELQPRGFYGLAIALGGVEVTMEEVGALYGMLGNGGVLRPPALLAANAVPRPGQRLLSPEAAFITRQMLAGNPRPGRRALPVARETAFIPWKTGTSYAFRDAWTAGLVDHYAVVVWVGNFDGSGNPAFVGRQAAAPLFFRLADALRAREPALADTPPSAAGLNVSRVEVCAASGDLPGRHCPRTTQAWFIPGVSPIRVSDVFRAVHIDTETGLRACPGVTRNTELRVYEFWSTDLLELFRRAGLPRRTPPPFAPHCPLTDTAATGAPPRIITPQPTVVYSLRPGRLAAERIPFTASADADTRSLFWFVDGRFLGRTAPDEALFWRPRPGRYRVRVADDLGRADSVAVRVSLLPEIAARGTPP